MATVTAASISVSDSLERFRQEFNTLRSDVSNITSSDITINNESNNRILTSVSTNTFNAEAGLTYDGSTFAVSGAMTVSGLTTLSGNLVIPNAGNIGSAGDTDAIAIASDGVVTMNQIPVFSAGINVSGGSIAGTLSTAAQGNITSLGTLTTLTVDNIVINGTNIGHTSDTDAIAIGSDGDVTLTQDLELQHDGAILSFGANDEISLTHNHNVGLKMTSTAYAPFARRGEDVFIVLDGTDASSSDAGDNVIMNASDGSSTDDGDDIIGEDEVFLHSGMQRNVIEIRDSGGGLLNSVAGFAPGAI
jgi:hypothetical protein